jgi:hypothetical protein
MLLIIKLAKLKIVVFKNIFCLKFNIYASIRLSIYKEVAFNLITTIKFTSFYKLIYYISLRRLGK